MEYSDDFLKQISSDLGLNVPFVKGQAIPVNNCWHFTTMGSAVDAMFYDDADFAAGMNRLYVLWETYDVAILAFALMDTHIHLVLYGEFETCNKFVHEYVRRTSMYISKRHNERKKLEYVPIHFQHIDTDVYLKTAICYTLKNAPVGGMRFTASDNPWSSGSLMFRSKGYWCSPNWEFDNTLLGLSRQDRMELVKSHADNLKDVPLIDGIIFPGVYVAVEIAEALFRSPKGFNYYMCKSKESDMESIGESISYLSLPMWELRQHKNEICMEMFGTKDNRKLPTDKRVLLARVLRSRYNCSRKQIARLCGLIYDEVKDIL